MNTGSTQQVEQQPAPQKEPSCKWCKGYGFMRLLADGDAVEWDSPVETSIVAACYCRWGKREDEPAAN
ncbi:MAG: hypothetical protein WBV94_04015 [Blastocatellia bacterium]